MVQQGKPGLCRVGCSCRGHSQIRNRVRQKQRLMFYTTQRLITRATRNHTILFRTPSSAGCSFRFAQHDSFRNIRAYHSAGKPLHSSLHLLSMITTLTRPPLRQSQSQHHSSSSEHRRLLLQRIHTAAFDTAAHRPLRHRPLRHRPLRHRHLQHRHLRHLTILQALANHSIAKDKAARS